MVRRLSKSKSVPCTWLNVRLRSHPMRFVLPRGYQPPDLMHRPGFFRWPTVIVVLGSWWEVVSCCKAFRSIFCKLTQVLDRNDMNSRITVSRLVFSPLYSLYSFNGLHPLYRQSIAFRTTSYLHIWTSYHVPLYYLLTWRESTLDLKNLNSLFIMPIFGRDGGSHLGSWSICI